jgi:predicted DNA-binding transcriptional regulator AlpA
VGVLEHLTVMKTEKHRDTSPTAPTLALVDGVLSLSELCTQLQVSAQTIYDLRSQGRGPRGFRVGRELRFRAFIGMRVKVCVPTRKDTPRIDCLVKSASSSEQSIRS